MFNLPPYPDVYHTRHITCVSCKEKFVVTEGRQAKNLDDREWHVRPNVPSTVNLHYEDKRQQRPIVPPPSQTPLPPHGRIGTKKPPDFTPHPINCPRCGADNRNWMALNDTHGRPKLELWQQRFPNVFLAIPIGLVFMALAVTLAILFEIHIGKAAIMFLLIPAFILGIIWEITREWNALRENQHVRRVLPNAPNKEAKLWWRGITLVILFTLAFPILFFTLVPATYDFLQEAVEGSPESKVNAATTAVSPILDQHIDAAEEEFATIADKIQELVGSLPVEDLPQLETEIETLSTRLAETVAVSEAALVQLQTDSTAAIEARRNEELATVKAARNNALGLVGDLKFLSAWGIVVGLPTLLTLFIAMGAVKQFVGRVDRDLPPPVFYSVANMTRLVTWEARQALEIGGNHHFSIQWMSVDRNEQGGIDLVGLFRDPPEFDMHGRIRSAMVRAQRHTVRTDKWCRVTEARIEDVMVPIPVGAPAGAMQLTKESQDNAASEVRIRLPEQQNTPELATNARIRLPQGNNASLPEQQNIGSPATAGNVRMPIPR